LINKGVRLDSFWIFFCYYVLVCSVNSFEYWVTDLIKAS